MNDWIIAGLKSNHEQNGTVSNIYYMYINKQEKKDLNCKHYEITNEIVRTIFRLHVMIIHVRRFFQLTTAWTFQGWHLLDFPSRAVHFCPWWTARVLVSALKLLLNLWLRPQGGLVLPPQCQSRPFHTTSHRAPRPNGRECRRWKCSTWRIRCKHLNEFSPPLNLFKKKREYWWFFKRAILKYRLLMFCSMSN